MKPQPKKYLKVEPLTVRHYCEPPYLVDMVARVVTEEGKEQTEIFVYFGHGNTVLVDEKTAFDHFGRRIIFGENHHGKIESVLEILNSDKWGRDYFLVKLSDGMVSWAYVERSHPYDARIIQYSGGGFALPARFPIDVRLMPVGERCEWIRPLPPEMKIGGSGNRYIGKQGDSYCFLGYGGGYKLEMPIDGPYDFPMPLGPISDFCTEPLEYEGRVYVGARVDREIYKFFIEPGIFGGRCLQSVRRLEKATV